MDLESQITFMVEQILLEIRSKFKWDEFKKIDNPLEKRFYLEKTGTVKLGEGSSRVVYLLSNRFVLKLALPEDREKGRAQNKAEVEISQNPGVKKHVARVYDYDDEYDWIVSDLVRPLKSEEEFEKLTGIEFDIFDESIVSLFYSHDGEIDLAVEEFEHNAETAMKYGDKEVAVIYKKAADLLSNNKWLRDLIYFIEYNNLNVFDIVNLDHWGKTADGRVVLLDYGFTNEIAKRLYGQ